MTRSLQWRQYFEANAQTLLDIPWHLGRELTPDEVAAISKSLQEFQVGESSEGRHLFRYAQAYAAASGDHEYVNAIRLFIAEEQRHARDLATFLQLNGIPLVRTTFADSVFRRLRKVFAGLEISIAVLITAEIIAQVYYDVLRAATGSKILRRLCDQILQDELRHVQFQSEQLQILRAKHGAFRGLVTKSLQRFLFFGTVLVVWVSHRQVIRRAGMGLLGWWRACWRTFNAAFSGELVAIPATDAGAPETNIDGTDGTTAAVRLRHIAARAVQSPSAPG